MYDRTIIPPDMRGDTNSAGLLDQTREVVEAIRPATGG